MPLTITNRPEKDNGSFISRWNALNLPNQYTIESDLFPVNNVDAAANVVSYSNNKGSLQVEVTGHGLSRFDWVTIAGSDTVEYNGVWQIRSKVDNNNFIVGTLYIDNPATKGTSQKYYNNYKINVEVYAGIRDEHVLTAEKPMQFIGTILETPSTNNEATFNIARFIKDQVNTQNDLSDSSLPNYVDNWTSFYIKYYESYDLPDGNTITTYSSAAVDDDVDGCSLVEMVTNGDFPTDISGWSTSTSFTVDGNAYSPTVNWAWNAGKAEYTGTTTLKSALIYQPIDIRSGTDYTLTFDYGVNNTFIAYLWVVANSGGTDFEIIERVRIAGVSGSALFNLNTPKDYTQLGFVFSLGTTDGAGVYTLDNISLSSSDCRTFFWGTHSTLPFQNAYGGNLSEYVLNSSAINQKFLTQSTKMFQDKYFDVSFILDGYSNTNQDPSIESEAYMWLDASTLQLAAGAAVTSWTDRTGNVTVTAPVAQEPIMNISGVAGLPSVSFNGVDQYMTTDINVTQPYIIYSVVNFTLQAPRPTNWFDTQETDRTTLFATGTTDAIVINSGTSLVGSILSSATDYVFKTVHEGSNGTIYINNVFDVTGNTGSNGLLNSELGRAVTSDFYNGDIAEIIIMPVDTDPCLLKQVEDYLGNKYSTYTPSSSVFAVKKEYTNGAITDESIVDIDYKDEGVYRLRLDDITGSTCDRVDVNIATSQECNLSEVKSIEVDRECSSQEIYLTWLSTLGSWEYWKFTAKKEYGVEIYGATEIVRDITSNWDTTFINGETQRDLVQVEAGKAYSVVSQYMTEEELEIVKGIMYSIKVQAWVGNKKQTVIVNKDSFTYKTDGDKLFKISFTIQFPNIQIQSQ